MIPGKLLLLRSMRPITLGIGLSVGALLVASCGSTATHDAAKTAKPAKSSRTTTTTRNHSLTPTTATTLPPTTTPTTTLRQSNVKTIPATTPTTTPPRIVTTTTVPATTTTAPPSVASCTNPSFSSSEAEGSDNTDPNDGDQFWWVSNDAWSGSHGPQSINVCSQSSWYATSNQPNNGGQVETYPDTEYDVGGRESMSTTPISGFTSITSTFSEAYPAVGGWDAAYDLWLNNWSTEIMMWNQWAGNNSFWANCANATNSENFCGDPQGVALTLDGVPFHFLNNGGELMFFRDQQVSSGSVDILAAFQWLVSQGLVKSTDVPTQLEYGVEISYTSGTETFPTTGLTFSLSQ